MGAGCVGVSTAIALAKHGHRVSLVDTDPTRLDTFRRGRVPFFETGADRLLAALARQGRIQVSGVAAPVVLDSAVVFLCVGTPSRADGSIDLSQIQTAAHDVGKGLGGGGRRLVVVKSTVIPGTTESLVIPALEEASGLRAGSFGVCANPEFLREGQAVEDSLHPSHVVIGELDRRSGNALARLYAPFRCPVLRTTIRVAEAVKYATNAFLATKVTFANEIANLCTRLGLDSDEVLRGMALDPRISPHHLVPGMGFGGSCFPKDVRALAHAARGAGYEPALLSAVLGANERQPLEAVRLLEEELGALNGRRIAVLGLAVKPGTDDIRESRALPLVSALLQRGVLVVGYDPRAGEAFGRAVPSVTIASSARDALQGADGCVIQAAWPEFSRLKAPDFAAMANRFVVDGRRTWPRNRVPPGITYRRIG